MHIITRQPGQAVVIDGDVTITLVEVCGDEVLLDIAGPPGMTVRCGEAKSSTGESEPVRQWQRAWVDRCWPKS